VRAALLLSVLVAIATWAVVRQLPESRAEVIVPVPAGQVQSVAIDEQRVGSQDRGLPLHDLRATLTTRPGEPLDDATLVADRAALEDLLEARGYLAAKVAPAAVVFGRNGGAYVVFDVERGPLFHLRNVTITGPGERDATVLTLAAGDEASRDRIARARQVLEDALARRSTRARVELRIEAHPATATVDVELATTEVTVMAPSRTRGAVVQ